MRPDIVNNFAQKFVADYSEVVLVLLGKPGPILRIALEQRVDQSGVMVQGELCSDVLPEEWLNFLPSKVLLRYVSPFLPLGRLRLGGGSEMKLLAVHPHSLRKSSIFFDSTCTKFLRRGPFPIHTSREERFA